MASLLAQDEDRADRIAQLWCALQAAADTGDGQARAFLVMFAPWAREQLRALPSC